MRFLISAAALSILIGSGFGFWFLPLVTLSVWYTAAFAIWGYPMMVCRAIPIHMRVFGPLVCPLFLLLSLIAVSVTGVLPAST